MLNIPPDRAAPSDQYPMQQSFDCSQLVQLRRTHETERAKKSVRTRTTRLNSGGHGDSDGQRPEKPVTKTPRREIIQQMSAILREQQDSIGTTSGLNRITRIQNQVAKPAGNSANAELAAGQRAAAVRVFHRHIRRRASNHPSCSCSQVVKRRQKIFTEHQVPYARELSDALLANPNRKQPSHGLLTAGDYGIIVDGGRLLLGRGMSN